MTDTLFLCAPCKINLHLRVCGKRPDGYHDVESVFQLISFGDELSVSIDGGLSKCSVISPSMVLPEENTCTKAVDEFRKITGFCGGVEIRLQKKVPAGAGLGGGSSDAAAVLKALDQLCQTRLSYQSLHQAGANVGSDVPFFLSAGTAIVKGRGEIITPIHTRTDLYGVLIWPEVVCATPAAYRLLDSYYENHSQPHWVLCDELAQMYENPPQTWAFDNSFTAPMLEEFPSIRFAIEDLEKSRPEYVAMSGSGSTVFALYSSRTKAESVKNDLSVKWKFCEVFLLLAS